MDTQTRSVGNIGATGVLTSLGAFTAQVYGWMTAGLAISAVIAWMLYVTPDLTLAILDADLIGPIFLIEIVLVLALGATFQKLPAVVSLLLYGIYAAMNGVVLGLIVYAFTSESVFLTFGATAITFIIMSVYGLITKQDLTKFGQLAFMGLIGLIVGSILNIFIASTAFGWILTYVGIGIFIVLIAYESQRIKEFAQIAEQTGQPSRYAIYAAFSLYLSFINLFIRLLAIFGKRR